MGHLKVSLLQIEDVHQLVAEHARPVERLGNPLAARRHHSHHPARAGADRV